MRAGASDVPAVHAAPDQDGVYYVGPEVTAPQITRLFQAGYPAGVRASQVKGMTVLGMVIDAAGVPQHIQILKTHGDEFDRAAIAAVKASSFAPARRSGKPVPVWVDARVVFTADHREAAPQIVIAERDLPAPDPAELEDKHHRPLKYVAPIPIHTVDADFDDPFTAHPWVQVAVVSVAVSKDGLPQAVRVVRGLGFGLDQKAAAAVWHYRFLPARKNGEAIAARRNVMVRFAIF
jgi:TonB family protein